MVFPSLPLYQDPSTWNQDQQVVLQQQQQQQHQQLQIVSAQPPRPEGVLVRPNSMADRARLAKIPQPEQPLKCPRCESTNTKFCYFNNYSLSQPRHFCKACRRYWTRGGAMRNVPVGGGCRRNNKRNKNSGGGSSSKNSAATADRQAGDSSATSAGNNTASFPFMSTIHPMVDYTSQVPNLGLGFSGIPSMNADSYQHASTSMGMEQWRLNQIQQFPFLVGMESQIQQMAPVSEISYNFDGAPSVKMEDHQRGVNLARQYNINLGVNGGSNSNNARHVEQYWNGGGGGGDEGANNASEDGGNGSGNWMTNLSRFNSSSAEHLL